jgi:hypothetical protein
MIIFNEKQEDIVEEKHICYFTKNLFSKIVLMEVYEKKIKHPHAREHAYVFKIDTRIIKTLHRGEIEAGGIVLLEAAQNNMKTICKEDIK